MPPVRESPVICPRVWRGLSAAGMVLSLALLGCSGPVRGPQSGAATSAPVQQSAAPSALQAQEPAATHRGEPAASRPTPSPAPRAARTPLQVVILPDTASDRAVRAQRSRAQVAAAATAGGPDRFLTPLASIPAFDPVAYAADPEAYLSEAVPARALRDAGSVADVPALELDGLGMRPAVTGQPVTIRVHARPGAPVSFYCGDLAKADNGLGAISVQADATGWATATYIPEAGATDDAHISIASPVCTGVQRVTLTITAAAATTVTTP